MAKAEDEIRSEEFAKKGWLVCNLSPARDMLQQFAAFLRKSNLSREKKKGRSISVSANVMGSGGGIGIASSEQDRFFDVGIEIGEMLLNASKEGG